MPCHRNSISRLEARRIALRAQRFGAKRETTAASAHVRRLLRDLGAIQIDSVNVLVRSQYLPAFSRLGAYDRSVLDRLAYLRPRRAFEYWGHEASLLPIESYPLMRWRMEAARSGATEVWKFVRQVAREKPELIARTRAIIAEQGPMTASQFQESGRVGRWWGWSDVRRAVTFLFWSGEIMPVRRNGSFERVYDLTERVVPNEYRCRRIPESAAWSTLVEIAATACGIATETDLRDYFRLPVAAARNAVADLTARGRLIPVTVEGWKQQAYLHAAARLPRSVECSALLSPFDSLVWNRKRAQRLFDFDYRIEIYTPAHRRVHGYYVLPYLVDEALVARVDLKADRSTGALVVRGAHYERGAPQRAVKARLKEDLVAMARWLGLDHVKFPR
jgi:uncharacterized protein YcaQ